MNGSDASGNRDDTTENWSQQSEANESERLSTLAMMDESPSMSNSIPGGPATSATANDSSSMGEEEEATSRNTSGAALAPMREEPTLKEKHVERERQRRVETERARLKRQFAMSSSNNGEAMEDGVPDGGASVRENGSVAGTVGEGSIVAQMDPYEDEGEKFTYPMERFLQEQGTVIEEEGIVREKKRDVQNQGVVMERFLKEPVVVVEAQEQHTSEGLVEGRNVSFDMHSAPVNNSGQGPPTSVGGSVPEVTASGSVPSFSDRDEYLNSSVDVVTSVAGNTSIANVSMTCIASENPQIADLGEVSDASELGREGVLRSVSMEVSMEDQPLPEPESPSVESLERPRVLRLTEAEIQEMAAIEEASRSNAPPSDRDEFSDSSFVGELISDFGNTVDPAGTLSQGTPTTAMESASIDHSTTRMSDNAEQHHSIGGMDTASISSSSEVLSVTANPPSDIGANEAPPSPIPDDIHPVSNISSDLNEHNVKSIEDAMATISQPRLPNEGDEALDFQESAAQNAGIVNRRIRPGMVSLSELRRLHSGEHEQAPTSPIRLVASEPHMKFDLDGFDYDKNTSMSPASGLSGSFRELPTNNLWSPGSRMSQSPFPPRPRTTLSDHESPTLKLNYGTTEEEGVDANKRILHIGGDDDLSGLALCGNEKEPLIPTLPRIQRRDVPREITKSSDHSTGLSLGTFDHVIGEIRSDGTTTKKAHEAEAQKYLDSSILKRAFPERLFALSITLLIEIPVLLMVSGGSDRLCRLTGRSKYQLLMGFLPLSCAISGNVGLQSSTLTTRAISHGHITRERLLPWLAKEIGTALVIGLGMGFLLGCIAFYLSNFNFVFGFTVMVAQFVSIVTAGLTGTIAPLLFSFIFKRDAEKWGGPLETAIQDIVGTFAMVVLSYKIIDFFGPMDVQPGDMCSDVGF